MCVCVLFLGELWLHRAGRFQKNLSSSICYRPLHARVHTARGAKQLFDTQNDPKLSFLTISTPSSPHPQPSTSIGHNSWGRADESEKPKSVAAHNKRKESDIGRFNSFLSTPCTHYLFTLHYFGIQALPFRWFFPHSVGNMLLDIKNIERRSPAHLLVVENFGHDGHHTPRNSTFVVGESIARLFTFFRDLWFLFCMHVCATLQHFLNRIQNFLFFVCQGISKRSQKMTPQNQFQGTSK